MRHSLRISVLLVFAGLVLLATGCGSGRFASVANCRQVIGLPGSIAGMSDSAIFASPGPPNPGHGLATVAQGEVHELQRLEDAAPSDIKGALHAYASDFASFLQALEQAGFQPGQPLGGGSAAQTAALVRAGRALLHSPNQKQAWQRLHAWANANCKGVSLNLGT